MIGVGPGRAKPPPQYNEITGGGARGPGAQPPNDGVGGAPCTLGPPQL